MSVRLVSVPAYGRRAYTSPATGLPYFVNKNGNFEMPESEANGYLELLRRKRYTNRTKIL
jgi:hypothetical protein